MNNQGDNQKVAGSGPTTVAKTLPIDERPEVISQDEADQRLAALAASARKEMELLGHNHDWVPNPGDGAYNVVVIGGGQAGLGVAFGLQRQRIDKVKVLEAETDETIGCWSRYARMHTLRSPKNMKGIELEIPSLHTESWFRAKYGDEAWESTNLVPRLDWHEYLLWYRKTTGIDADYRTVVTQVLPPEHKHGLFKIVAVQRDASGNETTVEYKARRVVFSLGLDGGGGSFIPPHIKALPEDRRAHTEDDIDFDKLKGKRIIVVGGGASGFDNAGVALEEGAADVRLFERSPHVARQNTLRWMEFPGMQEHFFDLSDEEKWEFGLFNGSLPQPPTQASVWRAFGYDNFSLYENTQIETVEEVDGELVVTDNHGETSKADFIISATGYAIDLALRPEMEVLLPYVRTWKEAYPAAGNNPAGRCPYLGDGFQFEPNAHALDEDAELFSEVIPRTFHFSTGARVSHGLAGNQLSGIYAGITRMSNRIAKDIMKENWTDFFADFKAFENEEVGSLGPHVKGDPWFPQSPRY